MPSLSPITACNSLRIAKRTPQRLRRLFLEALEDRALLAAGVGDVKEATRLGSDLAAIQNGTSIFAGLGGETNALAGGLVQRSDGLIGIEAIAAGETSQLVADLTAAGIEVTSSYGRMVGAWISIEQIALLDTMASLKFARGTAVSTSVGATDSQGDVSMRTDELRTALGFDGTGVTVGVISDSFDTSTNAAGSYADDIASGDLPTGINVIQDGGANNIDEGRAMLQLIHDVAPGADLAFATSGSSQADFANNITALRVAGSDVIVDDIIFFAEPMFQDGIIAQSADAAVAAGVPYFSSAGNQADNSYQQGFRNSGIDLGPAGSSITEFTFFAHDFDPGAGVDIFQSITVPERLSANDSTAVPFSFQWSDPFFSVGGVGASTDLDVVIFLNGNLIAELNDSNTGGDAVEVFNLPKSFGNSLTYEIAIGKYSGPDPALLKYVYFRDATIDEFATNSSTSFGHNNSALSLGVAAAPFFNTPEFGQSPPLPEDFTSLGGTPILFDTAGNSITPIIRANPDFTAPDGTNTTFFGREIPEDDDAFPNFFGTSAAAPHAAALAALLLQADPTLTPAEIESALETTAINMNTAGFDFLTGHGLVTAVGALSAVAVDYGDAPNTYGTTLASNGARHAFSTGLFLGANFDIETDGQPSANATADDTNNLDDEDGVTFASLLIARLDAKFTVTASAAGKLDAWIDYNINGVFDAAEKIINSVNVVAGVNSVVITVPATITTGATFARFRLSTAGNLTPLGSATNGEVEDYRINISQIPPQGTILTAEDPANPGTTVLLVTGRSTSDAIIVRPVFGNPALLEVFISPPVVTTTNPAAVIARIVVFGLEGNDSIVIDSQLTKPTQIFGDAGYDSIVGGSGPDVIDGGADADTIAGGAGDDRLFGGSGDDYLSGDAGNDALLGQAGNDNLLGGLGQDFLSGGLGTDWLFGQDGEDLLVAGLFTLENDRQAIDQIMLLWTAAQPFNTRVASLALLMSITTADDGVADYVYGSTGRDWMIDQALRDYMFDFDPNVVTGDKKNF